MPTDNWTLGIILGIIGSVAINTGNNLQSLGLKYLQQEGSSSSKRKTHPLSSPLPAKPPQRRQSIPWLSPTTIKAAPFDDNEDDSQSFVFVNVKKSPTSSKMWLFGTFVFVTGSLLNFASYAFAAQSMLASLESIQFVTNLIFGRILLGARITETMLAGTMLTVVGTIMAVQFSSKETLELSTSEIKHLYRSTAYLVYLILMIVVLVGLHFFYRRLTTMQKTGNPIKNSDTIMPCIYSVWSALFGTQSVVQAKILAELLAAHTSGEENIFSEWFTYMTVFVWISTVVVWLQRLNNALETFDPLFIIPLLQVSFILFAIVSGGIFFQEFSSFNASQWFGFCFGIIVMFSGLVLLTPKPKLCEDEDQDLHRELLNLLLKQGGSLSNLSSAQTTPRSLIPSPNLEGSDQTSQNDPEPELIDNVSSWTPRFSRENVTKLALDVVKEVQVSSNNLLHGNGGSARIFSEVMISASLGEAERYRRRKALVILLSMIKANPFSTDGYNDEIVYLLNELNIEVPLMTPRPDRDVAHSLSMTQEKLHSRILKEIEQNDSPRTGDTFNSIVQPQLGSNYNSNE
jgi:drug/metabolite transporter (DMT)-like permease